MKSLAETILTKRAYLDDLYDADIYKMDGASICKKLTRQFSETFPHLFNGEYKRIISKLKLCLKNDKKPKYQVVVEHIDALRIYHETLAEYDHLASSITSLFGAGYQGINTDFDNLLLELKAMTEIDACGIEYGNLVNLSAEEFIAQQSEFVSISNSVDNAFAVSNEAESRLAAQFNIEDFDLKRIALCLLSEKCTVCQNNTDQLDNWWEFSKLLKKIRAFEIKEFLNHIIEKKVDAEQMPLTFKKAFYAQWVDAALHESPMLLELTRVPHDEAVKRFKEKDELNFDINKAKIRAGVSAQRPNLDMLRQTALFLSCSEKVRRNASKKGFINCSLRLEIWRLRSSHVS